MIMDEQHRKNLVDELGGDAVRWDDETLREHRRDTWCLSVLRDMRDEIDTAPFCVVSPSSTEEVAKVLRYASANRLAVVPFGGGSGVCGGVLPANGSLVIDLRRMNRILELNDKSLFVRAEAGVMGGDLEKYLNEAGFSCRNFPQSIDLSTVGGWVATRAAGQYSTRYGNTEDILLSFEAVLADGSVVESRIGPRSATGPDLRQIFLGSEGTLGIVTEVCYGVTPLPETTWMDAFSFPTMQAGLEAIRLFMRAGWRPPVVRLYDAPEVERLFPDQYEDGNHLLLLLSEGPDAMTRAEGEGCRVACESQGGRSLGDAAVKRWIDERNHVPTFEELLGKGVIVDTIEVATTWDRIDELYEKVIAALRTVAGIVVASGHSSHSYAQGTNIYFTFAAVPDSRDKMAATYLKCWKKTMDATVACGGTIAHHHGIGRVRSAWMERELGEGGVDVLRRLKAALDPGGIMNPGTLLPEA